MDAEILKLTRPKARILRGRDVSKAEIIPSVMDLERVVELDLDNHVFRFTAESANKLAISLFGLSENFAEPVPIPSIADFTPGSLVRAFWLNHRKEKHYNTGGYPGGTYRVCSLKKPLKPGHVWVRTHPDRWHGSTQQYLVERLEMYRQA